MKKWISIVLLTFVCLFSKAESSNSLKGFCEVLCHKSIFQQPDIPRISPVIYSVKSLVWSKDTSMLSYPNIPKRDLSNLKKWITIVFRPQYIYSDFSSLSISARPNIKCYTLKNAAGKIVYKYEVDCLIFQSAKNKSLTIWDTGNSIGICIHKDKKISELQIKEQLENNVVKYTNYSIENINGLNFSYKKYNGFRIGSFKGKSHNISGVIPFYSWDNSIDWIEGDDFIALIFPKRQRDDIRSKIGTANRF